MGQIFHMSKWDRLGFSAGASSIGQNFFEITWECLMFTERGVQVQNAWVPFGCTVTLDPRFVLSDSVDLENMADLSTAPPGGPERNCL